MCSDDPFELEVDIIKDFVDIKKEIKDIFDIIDKYDSNYQETLEKVNFKNFDEFPKHFL